jgi:hypothetical protein
MGLGLSVVKVILALLVLLDQLEVMVAKDLLVCKAIQVILVLLVQLEVKVTLVRVEHRVMLDLMEQQDLLVRQVQSASLVR